MRLIASAPILLLFFLAVPVTAQDFDKGLAAAKAGDYGIALNQWQPLAKRGVAKAQHNLGLMYHRGQGVPQDYKKAIKWFKRAAEQGDPESQYLLALMYTKAEGVTQDYNEAIIWFNLSAEQGYADAQKDLAIMYENGLGVAPDYKKAIEWLSLASEQGQIEAQGRLKNLTLKEFFKGRAAYRDDDFSSALKIWLPLAKLGDPLAATLLGTMSAEGLGVSQDYTEAARWYEVAAEQDFFETDDEEYNLLKNTAIASSQLELGKLFGAGKGVIKDYKKASELLSLSASQGLAPAQTALGVMFIAGLGVPQDYSKAAELLSQGAKSGDVSAQSMLGLLYFAGHGVPKSLNVAMKWFKSAAEQGDPKSPFNLGLMHATGEAVLKDNILAYMWFNIAASNGDKEALDIRRSLSLTMTIEDISAAQALARKCLKNNYQNCGY